MSLYFTRSLIRNSLIVLEKQLMSSKRSSSTEYWRRVKKPRRSGGGHRCSSSSSSGKMRGCKTTEGGGSAPAATSASSGPEGEGDSAAALAHRSSGGLEVSPTARSWDFEVLPVPVKSPIDKKEYRVIRLANGLTALLVSDVNRIVGTPSPVGGRETLGGDEEIDEDDESDEEDDEAEDESDGEGEECSEGEEEIEDEENDDQEDEEMDNAKNVKGAGDTTKYLAAASLTVGVGSFEDPMEIQGLMHFLEHMVFMGSEKYPKENAFDYYIKKHGGHDNAHTDMEHTTFYFEVQEKHFYGGLDRFAQFFIKPLMKIETMTREREAVHSEFQMALPEDASRIQQLFASIAADDHPMCKFTWGNETTLNIGIPDKELHKKLHDLRLRYYSARNMTLAIQSRHSLDTLQEYVCQIFSEVPESGVPRPIYTNFGFPFPREKLHKLYRVVPTKDYHSVEVNWTLPSLLKHYRTKPLHYISHLLGHEGRGSILSYLKKKNHFCCCEHEDVPCNAGVWAVGLYSGNDESGFEHNSTYAVMSISVELTDEGFKNVDKVLLVIFQYLAMIQKAGPVERIFREIQQMEKLNFDYAEELPAVENVENLSECMQLYPPEDYLAGDTLLYEYNPEIIKECLNELTPDKCNIMLSSKTYDSEDICNLKERWFGTKYSVEDIPSSWENDWNNLPSNPHLHMPSPNQFIPDNFDLLTPETDVLDYPEKLCEDEWGELWFKQDQKFKLPRTYCNIYILSELLLQSPRLAALVDLYLNLFRQHVMEDLYPASMAQYSYSISATERGIVIKTNGFNQKIKQVIDLLLKHMETFEEHLDQKTFQEIRQQQMKSYHNFILKPGNVRKEIRLSVLQHVHWTAHEKLMEVKKVTSQDLLEEVVAKLFPSCHIRVLVQGNTQASQAVEIYNLVKSKKLKYGTSVVQPPLPELRTHELPAGCQVARAHGFNPADTNSSIINYYQGNPGTSRTEVLHEFIQMVMDEPVFDFLRTREQLGYNVYCTHRNTFGILGLSITVNTQANKFSVCHVDERIETFLKHFVSTVENMSEEEMSTLKETLISMKQTVDLTLGQEVSRNWGEIVDGEYVFDRLKKQIDLIKEITKEETLTHLKSVVTCKDNPRYRKLSVQIIGASNPEDGATPSLDCLIEQPFDVNLVGPDKDKDSSSEQDFASEQFIKDIPSFKKQLMLYPVTKIL